MPELRNPSLKLAMFTAEVIKKIGLEIAITPVNEYDFLVILPYREIIKLLNETTADAKVKSNIELMGKKIYFYFHEIVRGDIPTIINEIVKRVKNKTGIQIMVDIPSDQELVAVTYADTFAIQVMEKILKAVKEKNSQFLRIYKFKYGEYELENMGTSFILGVIYQLKGQATLEELVKSL